MTLEITVSLCLSRDNIHWPNPFQMLYWLFSPHSTLESYWDYWQVAPVKCHIGQSDPNWQRFRPDATVSGQSGCCCFGRSSSNIEKPRVGMHLLELVMSHTNTTLLQWMQSWIQYHQRAPAAARVRVCVLQLNRTKTECSGECVLRGDRWKLANRCNLVYLFSMLYVPYQKKLNVSF